MKYTAAILLSLLFLATIASGETIIPGGNVSGLWTQEGSPYLINGNIAIQIGDELSIEPGCVIRFTNHYSLRAYGRLLAVGTVLDPIIFEASNASVGWHGIRFSDTTTNGQDPSTLAYCLFQHGRAVGSSAPDKDGGAISCVRSSDVLVSHCTFIGNYADDTGGALFLDDGSGIRVEYSEFQDNSAFFSGGAIDCVGSSPTIVGTLLDGNSSNVFGGGISGWNGGNFRLENVKILNSLSGAASGFYSVASNPVMVGCLVAGNSSTLGNGGGGGITSSSLLRLTNTTVTGNQSALGGAGVWVYVSSIEIVNGIIWGNTPDALSINGVATVTYTNVTGGWTGEGNLDLAPGFVGTGPDPYALGEGSPCIDAGTPDAGGLDLPALDLAGNLRVANGRVDMGAYEFPAVTGVPDATAASLLSIHPNPFNPQTTIQFSLPDAGHARLTIHDLRGRLVMTLLDDSIPAGQHSISWNGRFSDGREAPSGVYLSRLEAAGYGETRKMMLIR
jgi:hypothetical protein